VRFLRYCKLLGVRVHIHTGHIFTSIETPLVRAKILIDLANEVASNSGLSVMMMMIVSLAMYPSPSPDESNQTTKPSKPKAHPFPQSCPCQRGCRLSHVVARSRRGFRIEEEGKRFGVVEGGESIFQFWSCANGVSWRCIGWCCQCVDESTEGWGDSASALSQASAWCGTTCGTAS